MYSEVFQRTRVMKLLTVSYILLVFSRQTFSLTFDNTSTTFVERCRMDCSLQRDFTTCGKFRIVRWIHETVREKEFSYGPFRLIRIPSMPYQAILPKVPRSRAFRSSIIDTINFVRDSAEDLLTKRAIVYTIDSSAGARTFMSEAMFLDDDEFTKLKNKKEDGDWRIFKKKKSLILPLLILLNLFKLKLLLLPIFLGVHFIKKLLVLGSLILPSILAHLKVCKVQHPQPSYPYHTWATAADAPADYPTGYGQEESAWAHRNDIVPHLGYPGYHGYRNPYG